MCDLNEDKLSAEAEMIRVKKNLLDGVCMKCKECRAVVVVRIKDPMCCACFMVYTTHKFRATLGKSKLIRANDKVLLAVSGGHSSIAMLHFVKEALSEHAHKRLKFSPAVVFIDESCILEDLNHGTSFIKRMTEELGYPYYHAPIHQIFSNGETEDNTKKHFTEKFNAISSLTAKLDFIASLRMELITQTARNHGYNKVMVGENTTTLSIKLLCNISQGRGSTIPKDIAVGDDRYEEVTVVRPMREFSSKEVAMYIRLSGIHIDPIPNLHTKQEGSSSLQRQTEEFIAGLQAEFPSTVSTVFRTGDKLCSGVDTSNSEEKCWLCHSSILLNTSETREKEGEQCEADRCCGSSGDCGSNKFQLSVDDVKSKLCYGCNLTFRDMKYDVASLPEYTLESISTSIKRKKMKETIQDFLLE